MNPQNLEYELPSISADIPRIVRDVRAAFDGGRTRSAEWRRRQLERMREMIEIHKDEFVDAIAADTGRPPLEAWSGDIAMTNGEIAAALRGLEGWMKPRRGKPPEAALPASAWVMPEPLGVALVIAPWNYPFELVLNPAVGAIAAGNCVVLKPSELAPRTSAALARRIPEYMDRSCIVVVEGGVPETEALLVEKYDHIFYTGSGRIGRIILEAAAPHLTPVTLELGGKSPCIVARDANLDVAAKRICLGKFFNAGQTCVAPDYVLVEDHVKDALLARLAKTIDKFYGGDPKSSKDYGRIANDRHYARLIGLLEGQNCVIGGESDPSDRFIAPTVVTAVSPEADIMQEEIFGPVLPVLSVADLDQAVAFVNERPKPLALYVFSESRRTQDSLLAKVTAGGACVNATLYQTSTPNLPFGGVGASGMGRYHGVDSFETFSHFKSVVRQSTRVDLPLVYPPYGRVKTAIAKKFV